MSEQLYDFFGEIFQRYFTPAIDAYPQRVPQSSKGYSR